MISIFHLKKANPSNLLSSSLYDERNFYKGFTNDLRSAKHEVIIESPYLTVKRSHELAPLLRKLNKRNVYVRVNTREPRHHTRDLRNQALQAIQILKGVGVRVYVCTDLRHRKLAAIDGTILWEGSLNIFSQNNSREIMRRTVSASLCLQMMRFTGVKRKFW